jgi:hypothetical protein
MSSRILTRLVYAAFAVLWSSAPAPAQDQEIYTRMLTDRGVSLDASGLGTLLKRHVPGSVNAEVVRQALADLGHDDYARREAATQMLIAQAPQSFEPLDELAAGDDPEVRWRARLIAETVRQPGNDLLYAALVIISAKKVQGLAGEVLAVAPLCDSESSSAAMNRALVATSTPRDADRLRTALKHETAAVRMASLSALVAVLGEKGVSDALPLLDDPRDEVRMEATSLLLPYRREESLRTAGKLLSSETLNVRNRAIHLLRSNIKANLPYSGYEPAEDRARHAAEWQKTIEANLQSPDAGLTQSGTAIHEVFHDRAAKLLVIVHENGTVTTRRGIADERIYRATSQGTLLYADRTAREVVEVAANDAVLWRSTALDEHPLLAVRRSDGVVLVTTLEESLLELNAAGHVVRKSSQTFLTDMQPLDSGATLLLSFSRGEMTRVDVTGRVESTWRNLMKPTSVCVMDDGRYLLTQAGSGTLLRLDNQPEKAGVPIETPFIKPQMVRPWRDGQLLVRDEAGIHIADRQGSLVRTIFNFTPGFVK